MDFSSINRSMVIVPDENRLIRQAKSGDLNAFVQLYDAYVERVYRYIHFLVPNNRVAEGLTFQVFFKAWKQLEDYQIFGSSLILWLYSVAKNQVSSFHHSHKTTITPDTDYILSVRSSDIKEELRAIRNGLQFLPTEQQQVLVLKFIVDLPDKTIARVMTRREGDVRVLQMLALQAFAEYLHEAKINTNMKGFHRALGECLMRLSNDAFTLDECLLLYPNYAAQLEPILETALLLDLGREVRPAATFNAYTRDALIQYIRTHPRKPKVMTPMYQRSAFTFALLIVALLISGTAQAQSALPGDSFYAWKRTSEQVLRAISPDPVATDIMLADRRLDELIAVADDPALGTNAMNSYMESVSILNSKSDVASLTLIVPALNSQRQKLNKAGISTSELDHYLIGVVSSIPVQVSTQVSTQVLPTSIHINPTAANIPPTAANIPPRATNIPPTATNIPPTATNIPPTATNIPPTATNIPPTATDVPPTATDVPPTPTDVPPTPTDVPPTAVPPTVVPPTAVPPTDVPPTAVPPTDMPTVAPAPASTNQPIP
jgi:DNA-directed RNA polymerase specialized sigma24 family protein